MQSRARRRYGADDTGDSFAVITIGSDGAATSASSSGTSQHHHQRVEDDIPEKPKYPAPSSATSWLPALSQRIFASVAPAPTNPAPRNAWNEPPPKQQQQGFWASEGQREEEEDEDDDLLGKNSALPEFTMTARDRSGEFASAIRSLQGRNIQRAVNLKDPRKAKHMQSYAEFMMIAKHIGKNIASTYTKLEKLTLLAKKKTLFDDRPAEIQELTYIIKGDLNSLNQQIARLQEVSKSQRRSTSNGKHLLSHSSNMVVALQAKLANMSSDFKQVLEVRTENLKQQKTRRDQFSQGPMAGGLPPSTMRGSTQGSLLLQEQQDQVCIDMGGAGTSGGSSSERAPLLQQQQQQQQHQSGGSNNSSDKSGSSSSPTPGGHISPVPSAHTQLMSYKLQGGGDFVGGGANNGGANGGLLGLGPQHGPGSNSSSRSSISSNSSMHSNGNGNVNGGGGGNGLIGPGGTLGIVSGDYIDLNELLNMDGHCGGNDEEHSLVA